jgi:xyloglucan-specific exo-beta-1,4-glucanase
MYRSDDHGDNWTFISGDLPFLACYFVQGVAVAAENADVVYQAVGTSYDGDSPGRGVWKSTDGGTSWTQVLSGVNFSGNDEQRWGGECLAIEPGNDDRIWAGSRKNGLRYSDDAGETWTNIAPAVFDKPNVAICGVTLQADAPDHIWVCGDGGAWVSVNHGKTWKKKITAKRIYRIARKADGTTFAAGINGKKNVLFRITASDWSKPGSYVVKNLSAKYLAALPFPPASESHLATVQTLKNGDVFASDLFENTCVSTDDGASFTKLPMTLNPPLAGYSTPGITTIDGGRNGLIQDPTSDSRLFLGGGYAPFRSDDGGTSWRLILKGVGETVAWRANFHPTDANRVWLPLADLGCTTVSDAGASGESSGYIAPQFPFPDDNVMFTHRLLISANKVIAPGGEQSTNRARLYQTIDNGATWTKLAGTGLPKGNNRAIVDAVASADNADDFLVFPSGVTGPGAGGVYRTTDGGATFTQATGIPAGFQSGAEFYWNVSMDRDATDLSVRFLFLRNRGFYKSTNRGASWTRTPVQPRNTFAIMHVDSVTGRIWTGTGPLDDGAVGFDYSDDRGGSWHALKGVDSVTEFDVRDGKLVLLGRLPGETTDHVHYSANNGVSWREITRTGFRFANAQAVAIDPWRAGTVWISTTGRAISRFTPNP